MGQKLTMPVGKYIDKEVTKLPSDYLKWLAENWADEEICAAADEEYRRRTDDGEHFYDDYFCDD